jgi:hypothetical protein
MLNAQEHVQFKKEKRFGSVPGQVTNEEGDIDDEGGTDE